MRRSTTAKKMHLEAIFAFVAVCLAMSALCQGAQEAKPTVAGNKDQVAAEQKKSEDKSREARLLPETQAEDLFRPNAWETAELDFKKAASRIVGTNFLLYDPMLETNIRSQILDGNKDSQQIDTYSPSVGEAPPPLSDNYEAPQMNFGHHMMEAPNPAVDDIPVQSDFTLRRPQPAGFQGSHGNNLNQYSGSAINVEKPPMFSQQFSQPMGPIASDDYQEYAYDNAGSAPPAAPTVSQQSYDTNYDDGAVKGSLQPPNQDNLHLDIHPHGEQPHDDYQENNNENGQISYDNYEDAEHQVEDAAEGHHGGRQHGGHHGAVAGDVDDAGLPLIQEPPMDEERKKKKKNKNKNRRKNKQHNNSHFNDGAQPIGYSNQPSDSAPNDSNYEYNENDSKNSSAEPGDYPIFEDYFKPAEVAASPQQQNNKEETKDFSYPSGENQPFTSAEFNSDPDFNDAEDNYNYDEEKPVRPEAANDDVQGADVEGTGDFEDEPLTHSGPQDDYNGFRHNGARPGNWRPSLASPPANSAPPGGRRPFRQGPPRTQQKKNNFHNDFPVNDGRFRRPPTGDVYDAVVEDSIDGDNNGQNGGNQQQAEDYSNLDFPDDGAEVNDDLKHEDFKDVDDDNDEGRRASNGRGNSAGGFLAGLARPFFRFRQQSQQNSDEDEDLQGANDDVFADRYDDAPWFFSRD